MALHGLAEALGHLQTNGGLASTGKCHIAPCVRSTLARTKMRRSHVVLGVRHPHQGLHSCLKVFLSAHSFAASPKRISIFNCSGAEEDDSEVTCSGRRGKPQGHQEYARRWLGTSLRSSLVCLPCVLHAPHYFCTPADSLLIPAATYSLLPVVLAEREAIPWSIGCISKMQTDPLFPRIANAGAGPSCSSRGVNRSEPRNLHAVAS